VGTKRIDAPRAEKFGSEVLALEASDPVNRRVPLAREVVAWVMGPPHRPDLAETIQRTAHPARAMHRE